MKKFGDLGIALDLNSFTGKKIDIDDVLNEEIAVLDYKVGPSKYPEKYEHCLSLQISVNGVKRVLFSGSKCLLNQIEQVNKGDFPIQTTIVKRDKALMFT